MKYRLIDSMALRLLLTTMLALALFCAVATLGIGYRLDKHPDLMHDEALSTETELLTTSLRFDASGRPVGMAIPNGAGWIYAELSRDAKYRIVDIQGRTVLSSEPGGHALAPPGQAFDPARREFDLTSAGSVLAVRVVAVGKSGQYLLQVAGSARLSDVMRRGVLLQAIRAMTFNLGLALFIFTLVLACIFHRVLKPLRRASRETAWIGPRNLGARLSLGALPCELRPLVEAFNQCLARLEQGFLVQQEFLAAAAHELKTPLTMLRAEIELEERVEDKAALLREVDLMARHVQQLLQLAELSEIQNYQFAVTDMASIAHEATDYLQRRAEASGVEVDLVVQAPRPNIMADASAVFVLLKNILENAILHTPRGGTVRVRVTGDEICISDEGPGIPPEHLPHLFTRFWRAPGSRYDGAGLGLAICLEIAHAHGWRLEAGNTGAGGALFRLSHDGLTTSVGR